MRIVNAESIMFRKRMGKKKSILHVFCPKSACKPALNQL